MQPHISVQIRITLLTLLAIACHAATVPFPQKPLDCAVRAAADRGYEPFYAGDRPNTLLLGRSSGDQTDNLFVTATVDSNGVWHVRVIPSTMHFADATDPTDRTLPTSPAAVDAAAYVRQRCDKQGSDS
jgi:hypothetical protein